MWTHTLAMEVIISHVHLCKIVAFVTMAEGRELERHVLTLSCGSHRPKAAPWFGLWSVLAVRAADHPGRNTSYTNIQNGLYPGNHSHRLHFPVQ